MNTFDEIQQRVGKLAMKVATHTNSWYGYQLAYIGSKQKYEEEMAIFQEHIDECDSCYARWVDEGWLGELKYDH